MKSNDVVYVLVPGGGFIAYFAYQLFADDEPAPAPAVTSSLILPPSSLRDSEVAS